MRRRDRAQIDLTRWAAAAAILGAVLLPTTALAQDISSDFGDDATLTERAVQLVGIITVLALAPSILVMVTSSGANGE